MKHNRLHLAAVIWSAFGLVCLIAEYAHAGEKPIPPGLHRVMAEGAGRVANMTCDDVRAVVAWTGEARAVKMAREAGASSSQIDKALSEVNVRDYFECLSRIRTGPGRYPVAPIATRGI